MKKRLLVLKKYKKVTELSTALFCCVESLNDYAELDYVVDTYMSLCGDYGYTITNRECFKNFVLNSVITFERKLMEECFNTKIDLNMSEEEIIF